MSDSRTTDDASLLSAILQSSNSIHLLIDQDIRIVSASPAYAELMGYSTQELSEMKLSDLHADLTEGSLREIIRKSFSAGHCHNDVFHVTKDGKTILFQAECSAITHLGKNYLSCFLRDITSQREMQNALIRSEAQLNAASRIGRIAYWEYDIEKDCFTFNAPFYSILRTNFEEVGSYQLSAKEYEQRFVHPEDRNIVFKHAQRAISSKDPDFQEGFEHRMLYADGSVGYMAVYLFVQKDQYGRSIKTYGANQDITERKKAERSLVHSNRILHSIREINKLIKTEKDADSLLRAATRNLLSERGFEDSWIAITRSNGRIEKIITPHPEDEIRPSYTPQEKLSWIEAMNLPDGSNPDIPLHWETRRYDFAVNEKPYSTLCFPIVFQNRHFGYLSITGISSIIKTTEEQELSQELADDLAYALFGFELEKQKSQAIQELTKAKEIAETANKAKDEFLAVVSHEIRTPLNPILGYVHLLKKKHTDEKSRVYLDSIERAAQQQLSLIDNMLNFTRLDHGRITPTPGRFELRKLCHDAILDAQQSRLDLRLSLIDNDTLRSVPNSMTVLSDKNMLQELLSNLLSNACKYTPSGFVKLCIGYEDTSVYSKRFRFEVSDTGIGMDPSTLNRLFHPFTQADTSYTRRYEGVGLGLAICKKLVNLLGGEIGVESKPNEGSTFWFELELPVVKDRSATHETETPQVEETLTSIEGKRILLVEDRLDNATLARFLLEGYGAKVSVAENGVQAVKLCKAKRFDLIFMDLAMPLLDGFKASQQIRETDTLNHETPIVVLTADASPESQERCKEMGLFNYVTKPIDVSKLAAAIHGTLLST